MGTTRNTRRRQNTGLPLIAPASDPPHPPQPHPSSVISSTSFTHKITLTKSTTNNGISTVGGVMEARFAAASFPPMQDPTRQAPPPQPEMPPPPVRRQMRTYGDAAMLGSRQAREYAREHARAGKTRGGGQVASGSVDSVMLYKTPRARTYATLFRTSWSDLPRQASTIESVVSHAATSKSCPGIPWGQVPGLSGIRHGIISPIDSEGVTSPMRLLPKGRDYLKRARLLIKVLFAEAARLQPCFDRCFNHLLTGLPDGSPRAGSNIRARLGVPAVYDVHLVLRPPVPAEAFEIVSASPRESAGGHAVARLHSTLSPAEKVNIQNTWGPLLLAGKYLTPSLVHRCIDDGIRMALTSLGKIHIARDMYSVIPSSSTPPQMTLLISYINMDMADEESNSSTFTIHIFPVIIAAGIPHVSGFQLRMPTPHLLPYSRIGLEIMREFDKEVQDWSLFWRLEGRSVPMISTRVAKSESKQWGSDFLQVLTKRSKLKKEKMEWELRKPLPLEEHMRSWVISFEPLEERLLELSLRKEIFFKAKKAFAVFDEMVVDFSEEWNMFPPALTTSLKLWTIYKTTLKNRTVLGWLRSLFLVTYDCLSQQSCAYFLLPRINMLQEMQQTHVEALRNKFHRLLKLKHL